VLLLAGALELAADFGDGDAFDLAGAAVAVFAGDHALEVEEGEAPVAAGRAIDAQAAGIGPATEGRLVDAEDVAGATQADPAGRGATYLGFE
jgi:hypothetical protein